MFGDGVNVAARLEAIAPPSRICISEQVYSMISENLDAELFDRGLQKLKNIKNKLIDKKISSPSFDYDKYLQVQKTFKKKLYNFDFVFFWKIYL